MKWTLRKRQDRADERHGLWGEDDATLEALALRQTLHVACSAWLGARYACVAPGVQHCRRGLAGSQDTTEAIEYELIRHDIILRSSTSKKNRFAEISRGTLLSLTSLTFVTAT